MKHDDGWVEIYSEASKALGTFVNEVNGSKMSRCRANIMRDGMGRMCGRLRHSLRKTDRDPELVE